MAKINFRDVAMINHKLNVVDLPNHSILDYDMVTFKLGTGKFAPKSELLVVRSFERNEAGNGKIQYTTFRIVREDLANSIDYLIKQ